MSYLSILFCRFRPHTDHAINWALLVLSILFCRFLNRLLDEACGELGGRLSILFCRFKPAVGLKTHTHTCLSILFCRFSDHWPDPHHVLIARLSILFCRFIDTGITSTSSSALSHFQFYFVDSWLRNSLSPATQGVVYFQFYFVDSEL